MLPTTKNPPINVALEKSVCSLIEKIACRCPHSSLRNPEKLPNNCI